MMPLFSREKSSLKGRWRLETVQDMRSSSSNPVSCPETSIKIYGSKEEIRARKSPETVDAPGFAPDASIPVTLYGAAGQIRTADLILTNCRRAFQPLLHKAFRRFFVQKDEVTACLFHCFHPRVSPCGSRCGSELFQLIEERRQNIKYDRADDCPVRILIMMHQSVSQSCNLHPRDIRILLLEVF